MKNNKEGWRTNRKERLAYVFGGCADTVYSQFTVLFLTTYLLMVGISPVMSAGILLIVKAWDAINDTLFGYLVDKVRLRPGRSRFSQWLFEGKYLPWYRTFFILIPIGFMMIFSIQTSAPVSLRAFQLIAGYFIYDTGLTAAACLVNMCPLSVTDQYEERNYLMSWSAIGRLVGMLPPMILGTAMIAGKFGYTGAAGVFTLIGIALYFIPATMIHEHNTEFHADRKESYTLKDALKIFKAEKNLTLLCIVSLIGGLCSTGSGLTLFVCYYVFHDAMLSLTLSLISMIPMLLLTALMPQILKKVEKTTLLKAGCFIYACCGFLIFFPGTSFYADKVPLFLMLNIIANIGFVFIMVAGVNLLLPDIAESARYKTGHDCTGIVSAAQSFSNKVGTGFCSSFALLLLGAFGWNSTEAASFEELAVLNSAGQALQSPAAVEGLWTVSFLIPSIGLAICAVLCLFIHISRKQAAIYAAANSGLISSEDAESKLAQLKKGMERE